MFSSTKALFKHVPLGPNIVPQFIIDCKAEIHTIPMSGNPHAQLSFRPFGVVFSNIESQILSSQQPI